MLETVFGRMAGCARSMLWLLGACLLAPGLAAAAPRAVRELDIADYRAYLAEDHPVNQRVVQLILEPLGVELIIVGNGAAAVEAAAGAPFDIILMDMQMPVMDGLAATRAIRELERRIRGRRAPVIMLSANAMRQHLDAAQAAGADRHLAKPFTPSDLIGTLLELVENPVGAEVLGYI